MTRAWVITLEGTDHETEVIGILSARKNARIVKQYVDWLHALLHYGPEEHMGAARYTAPSNPYPAEFARTSNGVPVQHTITCGHNPFLVGRLAKDVSLSRRGNTPILKWTSPGMPIIDPSGNPVGSRPERITEAFVSLPFKRMVAGNG